MRSVILANAVFSQVDNIVSTRVRLVLSSRQKKMQNHIHLEISIATWVILTISYKKLSICEIKDV